MPVKRVFSRVSYTEARGLEAGNFGCAAVLQNAIL
jgi:hypothetical protein